MPQMNKKLILEYFLLYNGNDRLFSQLTDSKMHGYGYEDKKVL